MKKAIFLVEKIENNVPITLLEVLYEKLIKDLKSKNLNLSWLFEIVDILNDSRFDEIKFVSVYDFISSVELSSGISDDVEIYYFISCFHNLENFHRNLFLSLDPHVVNFLIKHNIPIILDASFEVNKNYYKNSYEIFEDYLFAGGDVASSPHSELYFQNLKNLEYYVIGSTIYKQKNSKFDDRKVKVYHGTFSGSFFKNLSNNHHVKLNLDKTFNDRVNFIKSRKIDENTLVWHSFSKEPRLSRALFQMAVNYYFNKDLLKVGKYSRLKPMRKEFLRQIDDIDLLDFEKENLKYITEDAIKELDNIITLDEIVITDNLNTNNFKFEVLDSMIWVVLETSYINIIHEFTNTASMVTEKSLQPIINGYPFIPIGGQDIGNTLKSYGFKNFDLLEFPSIPNLGSEIGQVIHDIWKISNKNINERIDLFESWKETAIANLTHCMIVNPKKIYLEELRKSKIEKNV